MRRLLVPLLLIAAAAAVVCSCGSATSASPQHTARVAQATQRVVDPCRVLMIEQIGGTTGWTGIVANPNPPPSGSDHGERSCTFQADGGNQLTVSSWVDSGQSKYREISAELAESTPRPYPDRTAVPGADTGIFYGITADPATDTAVLFSKKGTTIWLEDFGSQPIGRGALSALVQDINPN